MFLHHEAITCSLIMRPPKECYDETSKCIMRWWNKAILRSPPKQWQDHMPHIYKVTLELVTHNTERNDYTSKDWFVYIVIYVDETQDASLAEGSCIDISLENNYIDIILE